MTQRPLATYLTGLIFLSILPLVMLSAWWAFHSVQGRGQEIREEAQQLAHNTSNSIDHYLDARIRALSMLAVSPLADDPMQWQQLYAEAQGFQQSYGNHVVFSGVGDPMRMRFNTRVPYGTDLPPLPRPDGSAAAPQALATGQPAVGDSFMGPVANETLVAIVVPGMRESQVTHLILSTLEAKQLQQRLDSLVLPDAWTLTLTDSRGAHLAHRGALAGDAASPQQTAETFRVSSELSPWHITVSVPQSALDVPSQKLAVTLALLIFMATLSGVIGGHWAARRIRRQVAFLADPKLPAPPASIREIADVRKRLENHAQQLRVSEARHRELFEANPHPMCVYSLDTLAFLAVNDAMLSQYGYSRDEFMRMTIKDIRPPEDIPRLLANVEQVAESVQALDSAGIWKHITKDGRQIDVEIYSHLLRYSGQPAELVLAHDITDRLRVEVALRDSEAEFRTLIESMPQIVWVTRPDGWHLQYNQSWFDFTGLTLEESLGHGWNPAFHPDDRPRAARRWQEAITMGNPYEIEYRLRRADGAYRWMLGRALPLRDSAGQIVKWFGTCTDIHELKRTEERLTEAQRIGRIGDWEYDIATQSINWSRQVYEILGRDPTLGPPRSLEEHAKLYALSSHRVLIEKVELAIASGEPEELELLVNHSTGMEVHVKVMAVPSKDSQGRVNGLFGTIQDISEEKRAERALMTRAHQQLLVADFGRLALSTKDIETVFREAATLIAEGLGVGYTKVLLCDDSSNTCTLVAGSGWSADWIGRKTYRDSSIDSQAKHVFESQEPLVIENFRDETRFSPSPLLIQHGIVSGVNVVVKGIEGPLGVLGAYARESHRFSSDDIRFLESLANTLSSAIERRMADERLTHMALHDALTDLPNRILLTDRLNMAFSDAQRHGQHLALLFLDVDRFKNINDVYGHAFGDQILMEIAKRLRGVMRAMDTISRQGGDEFLIVVPELRNDEEAKHVAQKVLGTFVPPFQVEGSEVVLSASIGIACYPADGQEAETLLRNADAAMYVAKEQGRNCYQFYAADMHAKTMEHLMLEGDLRRAIENHQLYLEYQPQLDLTTGGIIGLEALVRWRHPTHGLVSPGKFIPIAEESGQIVPIGTWVLEEACHQHARWIDEGFELGTIAVNVSANQFQQPDFVNVVEAVLKRTGLTADRLELELTESMVMQTMEIVLDKLSRLHALGIKLAIDDFGTGYSSLSYLKQFPLHRLKIDQSFTAGLTEGRESHAITQAIIHMGHSLGLDVLAEGIETVEQEELLKTMACNAGQGYRFAKPLPAEEVRVFFLSR
ncbi:EAL domain-containing protein [Halomonas chromatireducens]|uniref:cyclic-guanylate-specific phosphodiesterase n=1 Tax=Halomonas chromatireducens TaxID=507626 RepID=A0A0X8HDA6_9GAMM|nr:EAL domain-containing protein [Halomonas chromatireducens]AMD00511.1 Phytochrome-like protein cph2 [Halomonas chromatireducens]